MEYQCKDCGTDVSNQPRYPDPIGNWYCAKCYQKHNPLKLEGKEEIEEPARFQWWFDFQDWIRDRPAMGMALGVVPLLLVGVLIFSLMRSGDSGTGGSGFSLFMSSTEKLKQRVQALADAGRVTRFEDLDLTEPDDEINALIRIQRAAQWLNEDLKQRAIELVRDYPFNASPEDSVWEAWDASAESAIQNSGDSLKQLMDLTPESIAYLNLASGPGSLKFNEHLNAIRTLSYLLRLNSLLWIHRGNASQAISSIDRQWLLSNSMREQPWPLAQATRVASLRFALRSMEQWIQKWRPDKELIDRWSTRLKMSDLESSLELAMRGDQAHAYSYFTQPNQVFLVFKAPFGEDFTGEQRKDLLKAFGSQSVRDFELFHSQMKEIEESLKEGFPARLKLVERMKKAFIAAGGDISWAEQTVSPNLDSWIGLNRPVISTYKLPGVYKMIERFALAETYLRALKSALIIEEYRLETGQPAPGSLDEFPRSIRTQWAVDPYGGFPMFYQKVGDVYRIYSHGSETIQGVTSGESILTRKSEPIAEVYIDVSRQKNFDREKISASQ